MLYNTTPIERLLYLPHYGEISPDTVASIVYARLGIPSTNDVEKISPDKAFVWYGQIPQTKNKWPVGRYWIPNALHGQDAEISYRSHGDRFRVHPTGKAVPNIGRLVSHFFEIDDLDIEAQLERIEWLEAQTGIRPAILIHSGDTRPESIRAAGVSNEAQSGKSIHAHILLDQALPATADNRARWRQIQSLLVAIFKSDKSIIEESQIMRAPSTIGYRVNRDLTLDRTGPVRIQTTLRAEPVYYSEADILARLTALAATLGLDSHVEVTPEGVARPVKPRKNGRPQIEIPGDTVIEIKTGQTFNFAEYKGSKIVCRCPKPENHKHGDAGMSAFIALSPTGRPYIPCSPCGCTYWPRSVCENDNVQDHIQALLRDLPSIPEETRGKLPKTEQLARELKSRAKAWIPIFRAHLEEQGFTMPEKRCGFTQGAENADSGRIAALGRGCNKLSCLHCAPTLLALKAAAIASSLHYHSEIYVYSMQGDETTEWIQRFRRIERLESVLSSSIQTQVVRFNSYVAFWGRNRTIILSTIRPEAESRKHSASPIRTITNEFEITDTVLALMMFTYRVGISTIEDLTTGEETEYVHLSGKVSSSQNMKLDPDEILKDAAKPGWEVIEPRTVSPTEAAEILEGEGVKGMLNKEIGSRKIVSSYTSEEIPDPEKRRKLLAKIALTLPHSAGRSVQEQQEIMSGIDTLVSGQI